MTVYMVQYMNYICGTNGCAASGERKKAQIKRSKITWAYFPFLATGLGQNWPTVEYQRKERKESKDVAPRRQGSTQSQFHIHVKASNHSWELIKNTTQLQLKRIKQIHKRLEPEKDNRWENKHMIVFVYTPPHKGTNSPLKHFHIFSP